MDINIDSSSPVPIYLQILEELKIQIAQGRIGPGDRLPSVRELSVELRINPRTVSSAYRELMIKGLAASRKGIGLFLTDQCAGFAGTEAGSQLDSKIAELIGFGMSLGFARSEILERFNEIVRGGGNE